MTVIKMVMVSVASSHALRTDEAFHIEIGGQDMGIMSVCEAPHTDLFGHVQGRSVDEG